MKPQTGTNSLFFTMFNHMFPMHAYAYGEVDVMWGKLTLCNKY